MQVFPIVMMEAMNLAARPWDRINATKKNISDANRLAFVYQFHGIVMVISPFFHFYFAFLSLFFPLFSFPFSTVFFSLVFGFFSSFELFLFNYLFQKLRQKPCINKSKKNFSGSNDCDDHSDEEDCGTISCPTNFYKCNNSKCVFKAYICGKTQHHLTINTFRTFLSNLKYFAEHLPNEQKQIKRHFDNSNGFYQQCFFRW